jgi:CubicO group peptidase (beta-lactamase class C family)
LTHEGLRFSEIRETIRSRLVEDCLPSVAVAVARDGEILWEEAFGWADRENRVPATPHTLYSLASISKPITATGIMVLKARGKLDLDAPINDYLGDAKLLARVGDASEATVRRVANHSSGLPLHWNFFPEDEPRRPPGMDETIRRYGSLVTAPGERYQYSNLGYGILDYVISRVSGKSYPDFMRQEVFLPLGMTRSSVDVGPGLEAHAAARYDRDGLRLPFYDFDHPGGSAVFCSAHDLARFGMLHAGSRLPDQKAILSDVELEEMQAPTMPAGSDSAYGAGWSIRGDGAGVRTVSHGGGMDGVNTTLLLAPRERLAIAVLVNAATALPFEIADEILAAVVPAAVGQVEARREQRKRQEEDESIPFVPPGGLLGEWQGSVHTYAGRLPLVLRFHEDGDVHARLGEQLWTLVNEPRLDDGWLTGKLTGDIRTADAARRPYDLHLDLRLRGPVLNGAVIVRSSPRTRLDSALSHWTELRHGV